ncbi:MAG TPA: ATP-binding protein [Terriglobales bacterium]|nr:ATP-binding protein [Terriglobales bacterium]
MAIEVSPDVEPVSETVRTLAFQGVGEILFNTVKHAGTDSARVRLARSDSELQVIIEDACNGFHPQWYGSKINGFGLFSVKRRLQELGDALEVVSSPGSGTRMTLKAPIWKLAGLKAAEM